MGKPGTAVMLIKDNSKLVVMVSIGIEEDVRVICSLSPEIIY